MLTTIFIIALQIFFVVTANLLIKTGASKSNNHDSKIIGLFNKRILVGISSFVMAFVVMVFVLKRLPLNLAQAYLSLQYVAVTLAAFFILKEPISKTGWVGITLIALGVVVVGKTVA